MTTRLARPIGFAGLSNYPLAPPPPVLRTVLAPGSVDQSSHHAVRIARGDLFSLDARVPRRQPSALALALAPHAAAAGQEVLLPILVGDAYAPADAIAETYRQRRMAALAADDVAEAFDRLALVLRSGAVSTWAAAVATFRELGLLERGRTLILVSGHAQVDADRLAADLGAGLAAFSAFSLHQEALRQAVLADAPLPAGPAYHAPNGPMPRGLAALDGMAGLLRAVAAFAAGPRPRDDARRWYVIRLAELFALWTGLPPALHFPPVAEERSIWHAFVLAALNAASLGGNGLDTLLKRLSGLGAALPLRALLVTLAETGSCEPPIPSRRFASRQGLDPNL